VNLCSLYIKNRNIKIDESYHIAINEVVICESGIIPAKKTKTSKAQYSKLA
jgi:hypothetical protein